MIKKPKIGYLKNINGNLNLKTNIGFPCRIWAIKTNRGKFMSILRTLLAVKALVTKEIPLRIKTTLSDPSTLYRLRGLHSSIGTDNYPPEAKAAAANYAARTMLENENGARPGM